MNIAILLNFLTTLFLLAGLFFLLVGALGVLRFPDVYLRAIAASKCITLGITGMLIAAVFHFAVLGTAGSSEAATGSSALAASTKAVLVILFQFVAGPVGAYMLARAAHIDEADMTELTLSDDLRDDTTPPQASSSQSPPSDRT